MITTNRMFLCRNANKSNSQKGKNMKVQYSHITTMVLLLLSFCFVCDSNAASKAKKTPSKSTTETSTAKAIINIEPFGPFKWEDTPDIILNKLKAIENISEITTMETVGEDRKTYLDNGGGNFKIDDSFLGYKAEGILISGVPFNISIYLRPNPGVMILNNGNIPINKEKSLYLSHYLDSIELKSTSPQLIDKSKTICTNLNSKYGSSIRLNEKNGCDGREGDIRGGKTISIACNNPLDYGCLIEYSNSKRNQELTDIYTKHLSNIENTKNKGKVDMGSSL